MLIRSTKEKMQNVREEKDSTIIKYRNISFTSENKMKLKLQLKIILADLLFY